MSRYYAEYVPPPSRRSYDRSPPPYLRDRERERDRVREYESSSRRYERRSRTRSPDPRYERPYEPRKRYEDDRDHYYEDRHRRETEYPPAYDDRRHASSRRSRSPAPRYDRERDRSRDREETKKSEYEIEYDPKTRTFQGPSVKGSGPQPAYVAAKSMPIPKSSDYDDKPKRRKARKGPIANYMDPDIYPNEKVICPYNNAHIVQRKRLQGHLLYCRKKFPNPNLKICPLNVLHVVKEEELENHILSCPDREIVKYLTFEPDFEKESPPRQGFIESSENWDDDVVVDYDPNIQVEKFKVMAEEADKEGYVPPSELPPVEDMNVVTSPVVPPEKLPEKKVEINGEIVRIKVEKPDFEDDNEHETMKMLDEEMKDTEPEPVREPIIRVKKEWSPIPAVRKRSPSLKRRSPILVKRYSPSVRRRSPSPRRRSPLLRRRSPSPHRRSRSPRRRSPSPRRRSPGYYASSRYRVDSPPREIKREREGNGYGRLETSRRYERYERSPPPYYRPKDDARYEDDHSRKIKYEYDDYYARKGADYDRKPSVKDLYPKYEDDYERRPRYEERRRTPSPKSYGYRPRSRSPARYEVRSRSPRSRSRYDKERSPGRYERRKTPPLGPSPKSSKDYYDYPGYDREKDYRKIPEPRIKTERGYSPPRSHKIKEGRKTPLL